MSFVENIRMAFSSVLAHKLRSILTMLGIIIGVASVILVVAIGQGGEQMLKSQFTGTSNTIEVFYQPSEEEMQSDPNAYMKSAFDQSDINDMAGIPEVEKVVASSSEFMPVRHKEETADTSIFSINQAYIEVNQLKIESGRNLMEADFIGGERAGIISQETKKELFKDTDPIGEIVWINGQPIEIVGVLEKPEGLFSFGSMEIYIPSNTYRASFGKSDFNQVTLQAKDAESLQEAGKKPLPC